MEVEASAPGKVFLLGEYAVALGAPAVVAAVDRRLHCRVSATEGRGTVTARSGSLAFVGPLGRDDLEDAPRDLRFVVSAARVAARAFALRDTNLELTTRSDLDGNGPKVGLGGSAAAVAAVIGAVHEIAADRAGRSGSTPLARAALGVAAHRLAQGGGSGGDVLSATLGGLQYVRGLDAAQVPASVAACCAPAIPEASGLELPEDLVLEVVGTGESASTGPRVRRFVERARDSDVVRAWIDGMGCAADVFADGCARGAATDVLRSVRLATRLLSRLGAITGIGVFTPRLRAASSAVPDGAAAAVKPSGAGGGDCAIAVLAEGLSEAIRAAWCAADLEPLEVRLSPDGVRARVVPEEG